MTKAYARNDLFDNLEQILLRPFSNFSGRDSSGRMGHKHGAQAVCEFRIPDDCLDLIRQVDDLFQCRGLDL